MLLLSKSTIIGHVIRTVCDEHLLLSVQNTLSDGVTLNMGEVNDAYL